MPDKECEHANGEYEPSVSGCLCSCEKCYDPDEDECICPECDH